jgi:hypothetical protein
MCPLARGGSSAGRGALITLASSTIELLSLVGLEGLLVLPPFRLREDLEEHDQDDTGPERIPQRVEQVAEEARRPRQVRCVRARDL